MSNSGNVQLWQCLGLLGRGQALLLETQPLEIQPYKPDPFKSSHM
jgi:hypothetical protein